MANGIKVVYTLEDLKEITDKVDGTISLWGFHHRIHDGHRAVAKKARELGDFVVGQYWSNAAEIYTAFNGFSLDKDLPLIENDIKEIKELSDVVMIFKKGYIPFGGNYPTIENLWKRIKKELPDSMLEEGNILGKQSWECSLRGTQAVKIVIDKFIKYDYTLSSYKDGWRHLYSWWVDKYCDYKCVLIEPILDKNGNAISGCKSRIPKKLMSRIDKKLLTSDMKTIEDAIENIKDIDELKVINFYRNDEFGYMFAEFAFSKFQWWYEGINLKNACN